MDFNISDITVNKYLRELRVFFYYCMERDYIKKFKIVMLKADDKIKIPYSDTEIGLLLKKPKLKENNFPEYRNWVMVNYLIATGNMLRTMINIKIEDIDFESGYIILKETKNRQQQIIPLSTHLSGILREYISHRRGEPTDYLFCSNIGKQFQTRGVQTAIKEYNHSRGVEKKSIHLFRHYFAKQWIVNGGDIFSLQKILGHRSLDMVKKCVALYGTEIKDKYDTFNPLDNLMRNKKIGTAIRMDL